MPSAAPFDRGPRLVPTSAPTSSSSSSSTSSSAPRGDPYAGADGCVEHLLLHEKVMGADHVHHGGTRFVKELARLALPPRPAPGTRVLNIGCGFGGFPFSVTSDHATVSVHACDPNESVIDEVQLRLSEIHPELADRVHFECRELDELDFPPCSFDAIVCVELNSFVAKSKDKKELLCAKFKDWLNPSGRLVMADYCWSKRVQEQLLSMAVVTLNGVGPDGSADDDPSSFANLGADDYRACLKSSYSAACWVDDRTVPHLDLVHRDVLKLEALCPGSKREDLIKRQCLSQWKNLCGLLSDGSLHWLLFRAVNNPAV